MSRAWLTAVVVGLGLVLLVSCGNEVRVRNDSPSDVLLFGCKREIQGIRAGEEVSFRPFSPCWVRDRETREPLGCLRFPPEAFDMDVVTLVSSMEVGLHDGECVRLEDY